jgi:hypothetical protein
MMHPSSNSAKRCASVDLPEAVGPAIKIGLFLSVILPSVALFLSPLYLKLHQFTIETDNVFRQLALNNKK